jgi:SWI/SNF-related matrix-associated actin-dependent regulator 1 of chromatin subfamily A
LLPRRKMVPDGLSLSPFQIDGVKFLVSPPEGKHHQYHKLLADDMGLGKTIQAIVAMNVLDAQSIIVVCPSGVKIHWAREIAVWSTKKLSIFVVRDGKTAIPPADVIIVNYELMLKRKINDQIGMRSVRRPFDVCILDEAHYLKSLDAKRTERILGSKSFLHNTQYKWALTGTPVLNRPAELYPILYTLAPGLIHPWVSWAAYSERYCNAHRQRQCRKCGAKVAYEDVKCPQCTSTSIQQWGMDTKGSSNLTDLSERLKPFMLRRRKEDVLADLPPLIETIIELDIDPPSTSDDTPLATVRRDLALAKIPAAIAHIKDQLSTIDKLVVFGHHRSVIETLYAELSDYNPVKIYGGMTADEKQEAVDRFINDPNCRVTLNNTIAGGTGIDGLQKVCAHAIVHELDWSPGIMDQARDRLRRIGQESPVFVQYLIVPDSIDTAISDVISNKRHIIRQIIKANEVQNEMSLEQEVKRIADALELIAGALGENLKSNEDAPAKSGKKAKREPEPDPTPASTAAAVPNADDGAKPTVSLEDMRRVCGEFIAAGPDKDANRAIINTQIWPKYGVTELASLKQSDYPAALADLQKGPGAYANNSKVDLGV